MNDRQLLSFVAVAEKGSISAAAKGLFISPQAFQQQLNMLEEEVGVKLLVRSRSGCSATVAGEVLLEGLRNIIPGFEALLDKVRRAGSGAGPSVLVAGSNLINDPSTTTPWPSLPTLTPR